MYGMNPMSFALALVARKKGASNRDIVPLMLPVSGSAGTMLAAVSLIQNQNEKDALGKELKPLLGKADLEDKPLAKKLLERPAIKDKDPVLGEVSQEMLATLAALTASILARIPHHKEGLEPKVT